MHLRLPLVLGVLLPLTTLPFAAAQAQAPAAPAAAPAPATAPAAPSLPPPVPIFLADEPLRLDSVGLSVFPPAGCRIQIAEQGKQLLVEVTEPQGLYQILIRVVPTDANMASVEDAIAGIRRGLTANQSIVRPKAPRLEEPMIEVTRPGQASPALDSIENAVELEPVTLRIAGNPAPGARLYTTQGLLAARGVAVRGFTVFPVAEEKPEALVVFELTTPRESASYAQRAYELMIASATFDDPRRASDARRTAIFSGIALMRGLPREKLEALLDDKQHWARLSRPAPGRSPADATEIGYRALRFWKGRQAELQGPAGRALPPTPDNPEGYLAELIARVVTKDTQGRQRIVDTQGLYFMTPDRQSEAWTIRTIANNPDAPSTDKPAPSKAGAPPRLLRYTETGARTGRTISVSLSGPVSPGLDPNRVVRPVIDSDGYLNQFEALLLPRLLAASAQEGDLAWYAYRSDAQMVSLRRDTLRFDPAAPGLLTLKTTLRDEMAPQISLLRADGTLIRTDLPDGTTWEPIDLASLKRLWTDKGLPTADLR